MASKYILELVFTSQNRGITMNDETSEFNVISIEGLEASEYTIKSVESNQDGMIVTSKKIEPREIRIVGDIEKNDNEDFNRRLLISFFNPKFDDGLLKVNRNNNKKKISYEVSSFKFTNTNMYEPTEFEIILECSNPYFDSIDNYGKNIAKVTKQFAFPLVILEGKGKIMGYKTYNNNVQLLNDGDCETGCEIRIRALSDVSNPKILLNDKFIQVNTKMEFGNELVINTNERKKSITLNGENAIQKINRKSTFFSLDVGDNVMKYESDEGYQDMEIYVYFYKKYLGV